MMEHQSIRESISKDVKNYLEEDGVFENLIYLKKLPSTNCKYQLNIKSDVLLSGLDYFKETFILLGANPEMLVSLDRLEGQLINANDKLPELIFNLPLNVALLGERVALNLLQRSTAISTMTDKFVKKCAPLGIAVLDTRKTTPGLKNLEKYAVAVGGGQNHRRDQTQAWMIKDNHKKFWEGPQNVINFFKSIGSYYQNFIVEIHNIEEIPQFKECGVKHFLLDNFGPDLIKKAMTYKDSGVTFEISGGIDLNNIDNYLIEGVDAISIGKMTQFPMPVDISLKIID